MKLAELQIDQKIRNQLKVGLINENTRDTDFRRGNVLSPTLSDILEEVIDGSSLQWLILFLDGTLNQEKNPFLLNLKAKLIILEMACW